MAFTFLLYLREICSLRELVVVDENVAHLDFAELHDNLLPGPSSSQRQLCTCRGEIGTDCDK